MILLLLLNTATIKRELWQICPTTKVSMHIITTILTVNVSNKGQIHPLLAILEQCFDISVSCVTKFSILTGSFPPDHKMLKQVSLTLQTKNKIENPFYFSAPSIYWPISLPSIYNLKYLFTNIPLIFFSPAPNSLQSDFTQSWSSPLQTFSTYSLPKHTWVKSNFS